MAVTLVELKQRLAAKFDEVTLLELLQINAENIVEAFSDRIEEMQEELEKELGDDDEFAHQQYQEQEG